MATAGELISQRVAVGSPEARLADVAAKIASAGAHHCAVVDAALKFSGLIRLADVAGFSHAGNRLLADLVSSVQPLIVRTSEPAEAVTTLFSKHRIYEAVVLSDTGEYVGLATAESVLEFTMEESKRKDVTLQQTEARLVAASSARDIFLRSLSHELRTPLNPVLLLASDGATNAKLPADVRQQFETIATNVLLEAHLIDGLLDLTQASKGTIRLDLELTDVHAVLSRSAEEMRTQAIACGAELDVDLAAEKALVMGDAAKLAQAFRNLLRNAADAVRPSGHIRVASQFAAGDSKVTITFSDSGSGMTEAELARAFDPFPRPDETIGTQGGGKMAVGLALARAIIALHSGVIEAASEGPGRGTTFRIELPIASGA